MRPHIFSIFNKLLRLPTIPHSKRYLPLTETSTCTKFQALQKCHFTNMAETVGLASQDPTPEKGTDKDTDGGAATAGAEGEGGPAEQEQVPGVAEGAQEGGSKPGTVGETGESQSKPKLSRRAMKRIMRDKQREAAKMGQSAKRRKKDENRVLNFTEDHLQDADYYIENGLRKVYPYPFNFTTYAKGRWIGQKLLDVFANEFKAYDVSTYKKAIEAGRVSINGKTASPDYVLKDNDFLKNVVHRHELPVTADKLRVVAETDDVVVIDKPSSIPIHPCGRYRHNSLTYIMAKELGMRNLRTIYRLDRLTSGVFIFCKTDKQTVLMQKHIKNRQVEKTYVARVVGKFPSEPVVCTEPIDTLAHKIGLFKAGPQGKESKTTFELLNYNGDTSAVICKPHTGRTHQIRVHLQYLGYPIVNDPLYNTPVWGPQRGKGGDYGKPEDQLVEELIRHHNKERFEVNLISGNGNDNSGAKPSVPDNKESTQQTTDSNNISSLTDRQSSDNNKMTTDTEKSDQDPKGQSDLNNGEKMDSEPKSGSTDLKPADASNSSDIVEDSVNMAVDGDDRPCFDAGKLTVDPLCEECTQRYMDPRPEDLVMYLHALSYSGPGWKFETDLPTWAQKDWVVPPSVRNSEQT